VLAKDGTVVFGQQGAHGASVVTANGVEFHDRIDTPKRIVVRDPDEPWRAPVGFILPSDGRFTATSRPTILATTGFAITLRPSDTRVPMWGGEVLIRVDILAPAAADAARWGEDVAVVIEGRGPDSAVLAETTLAQLGGRDRVIIVDALGAKVVVPRMPASTRSIAMAAIDRRLEHAPRAAAKNNLAEAIKVAHGALAKATTLRRLVLITDRKTSEPIDGALAKELAALHDDHVAFFAVSSVADGSHSALDAFSQDAGGTWNADGDLGARKYALRDAVPAAGKPAWTDVVLSFTGTPAPSHVLEASGGDARWALDAGELALGDVRAGDERTEVIRVSVPAWIAGEKFSFGVTARFGDVSRNNEARTMSAVIPCVYDDDIERIAKSRNGDVIAYASALATLKRLDAAFVGEGVDKVDGLAQIAKIHAKSMELFARDMKDPASKEQADFLNALLAAEKDE
jgi:hypothetical protein